MPDSQITQYICKGEDIDAVIVPLLGKNAQDAKRSTSKDPMDIVLKRLLGA